MSRRGFEDKDNVKTICYFFCGLLSFFVNVFAFSDSEKAIDFKDIFSLFLSLTVHLFFWFFIPLLALAYLLFLLFGMQDNELFADSEFYTALSSFYVLIIYTVIIIAALGLYWILTEKTDIAKSVNVIDYVISPYTKGGIIKGISMKAVITFILPFVIYLILLFLG